MDDGIGKKYTQPGQRVKTEIEDDLDGGEQTSLLFLWTPIGMAISKTESLVESHNASRLLWRLGTHLNDEVGIHE